VRSLGRKGTCRCFFGSDRCVCSRWYRLSIVLCLCIALSSWGPPQQLMRHCCLSVICSGAGIACLPAPATTCVHSLCYATHLRWCCGPHPAHRSGIGMCDVARRKRRVHGRSRCCGRLANAAIVCVCVQWCSLGANCSSFHASARLHM
jgi:hypothetical protein